MATIPVADNNRRGFASPDWIAAPTTSHATGSRVSHMNAFNSVGIQTPPVKECERNSVESGFVAGPVSVFTNLSDFSARRTRN
jgi:hypothetical protein